MLLQSESSLKPNPCDGRRLELCGFGFGGLENGNARIGVLPSGEEFLVSGFGVRMTALPQCDLCLLQAGPESAQIAPYNGKVGPAAGRQLDRWLPGFHRSPWPW